MAVDSGPGGIEGFVLAGGRSTRFGGDKALASLEGRPLLLWALGALEALGIRPVVVSPRVDPYRDFCERFITWEEPDLGPAEGLRVALTSCSSPRAMVLSVDMPWVSSAALQVLLDVSDQESEAEAVLFVDPGGRRHPFPGLYRASLARVFAALRRAGGGRGPSVQSILDSARTRHVRSTELPGGLSLSTILRNVNRPEDLA